MTQLLADDSGIWRSDPGEADLGMRWEAVVQVTLHKVHDGTGVLVVLEFDDADGEVFVITDAMPGFAQVQQIAGERLSMGEALDGAMRSETTLSDPRVIWQRRPPKAARPPDNGAS